MPRIGLVLVLLGACGRVGFDAERIAPDGTSASWFDDRFEFRKTLTATAAPLSGLAEFPLLVDISGDPDLTRARVDGADLQFVFDGSVVPHEIEAFDVQLGSLIAWVRVPMLSTDTELELYFGSQAAIAPVDSSAVWAGQVTAVWHLHQAPSGPAPQMIDSSDGLAGIAAAGITSRAGIVASAIDMQGTNQTVEVGDIGTLDFGTSSFSYSAWVFVTSPRGLYDAPFFKGGANFDVPGYDFQLGTTIWSALLADGVMNLSTDFGPASVFLSRWVHLVAVVDRGVDELRVYADGSLRGTTTIAGLGSLNTTYPVRFGNTITGAQYRGGLDEVRIYPRALADEWITTEHANYIDPRGFVSIGALEER